MEISIFSAQEQPGTVGEWLTLLQSDRLLGLTYLNLFDVVNYVLVGVMLLALYALLRQAYRSRMTLAAVLPGVGRGPGCWR